MIGATVSHYRITRQIGQGGMGVVYEAHDEQLDRAVALKFLTADDLDDTRRKRFLAEAQTAARVHHPNICPIYEIGEHEGRLFFAMALIRGRSVVQLLRDGPLHLPAALDIAAQTADGLFAAHRQGIVHRDIKTANIAVDAEGHVWILDFGIAHRLDSDRLTATGCSTGTPAYMSPEQAKGETVDPRSDLWSLAVLLFEMLTARYPFAGDSQYALLHAIVNQDALPISTYRAGMPDRLLRFFDKAFAREQAARWQNAGEVAAELRAIADGLAGKTETLTSIAPLPPPSQSTVAAARPRHKVAAAIAGAVLAVALGGWAFLAIRGSVLPEEKRIAVLPFTVLGNDDEARTLADGIVETIASKLTQIEAFQGKLMVVPASEIRSRKIASSEDARLIYGANLALTGSVQRWNNRIQFTQNLVDTATDGQIASRTFEFDAAKPIEIRDKAVNSAVALLELRLSRERSQSLAQGETAKPAAYAAYLKGVGYLARYDLPGNVDAAIQNLSLAVQLDPNYALAYAVLGQAHWRKAKTASDAVQSQMALDNIQTAIRLDPGGADAHVKLGEIYSETGRSQEAIAEEEAALQAAPYSAEAYRTLGRAYASLQQYDKAEAAYRSSIERQPGDWYGYLLLGLFYWDRGRNADARDAWNAAAKLTPNNEVVVRDLAGLDEREGNFQGASDRITKNPQLKPAASTYNTLGFAYYYQRKYAEAAAAFQQGIDLDASQYRNWGNLGTADRHIAGNQAKAVQDFAKAIELANKSLEVMKSDYSTQANLAEYFAKLGEKQKALAALAGIPETARGPLMDRVALVYELTGDRARAVAAVRSLPANDPVLPFLRNDPDLDAFWRDPALAQAH